MITQVPLSLPYLYSPSLLFHLISLPSLLSLFPLTLKRKTFAFTIRGRTNRLLKFTDHQAEERKERLKEEKRQKKEEERKKKQAEKRKKKLEKMMSPRTRFIVNALVSFFPFTLLPDYLLFRISISDFYFFFYAGSILRFGSVFIWCLDWCLVRCSVWCFRVVR